jgi:hypothetical protein
MTGLAIRMWRNPRHKKPAREGRQVVDGLPHGDPQSQHRIAGANATSAIRIDNLAGVFLRGEGSGAGRFKRATRNASTRRLLSPGKLSPARAGFRQIVSFNSIRCGEPRSVRNRKNRRNPASNCVWNRSERCSHGRHGGPSDAWGSPYAPIGASRVPARPAGKARRGSISLPPALAPTEMRKRPAQKRPA